MTRHFKALRTSARRAQSSHLGQCEYRDTAPAVLRAVLKIRDREGYAWVECAACDCGWQVPLYAEESVR